MLKLPNQVFFGVPPAPERNRVVDFIKHNDFKQVIIPCAGRFAIAEAVVEAGIKPKNVVCGDISLFSSAVGGYLAGNDMAKLGIETKYDFIDKDAKPVDFLSQLLYGMTISKSPDNSYYAAEFKHAIEVESGVHIGAIKDNLKKLHAKLAGITYSTIDMMELVKTYKDNEDTFLFVDPPALGTGDYPKMFDYGDMITWNEPPFQQFGTEEDMAGLFTELGTAKATAMILRFKKKNGSNPNWMIHHVSVDTKMNKKFLFLNRLGGETYIDRPRTTPHKPMDLRIINTHDIITEDSVIEIIPVDRDIAWYYRDLFSHKFGAGSADLNYLVLVDGKIVSVRGYAPVGLSGGGDLHEIYGIIYNNAQYRHLGRLVMRCVTSTDFTDGMNRTIFPITGITTTTYKNYEVEREVKGIGFEVYDFEEAKDGPGKYKMKHRAPITSKTFKEHLADWLKEEESYGKKQERKPKKQRSSEGRPKGN